MKEFYSIKDFMELTGISRATAYSLIKEQVPVVKISKRRVLIPAWYVRKLTAEPQESK